MDTRLLPDNSDTILIAETTTISSQPGVFLQPSGNVDSVRVVWTTVNPGSTCTLVGSMDGSSTYAIATVTAGANAITTICDQYVGLSWAGGTVTSTTTVSNTWYMHLKPKTL